MIRYFENFPFVSSTENIVAIENTIAIMRFSDMSNIQKMREELYKPHKFNFFVLLHKISGCACVKIDMVDYFLEADREYMIRIAPGQIVSIDNMSNDFDSYVLMLSNEFIESLMTYMSHDITIRGALTEVVTLAAEQDVRTMEYILKVLHNIIKDEGNPYRRKVLEHVLLAMFYGSENVRKSVSEEHKPRTSADVLTMKFLREVKENFRQERQLGFYAERLCITPRYLSRIVRDVTGYSAAEWIERYVVLEARALLKSTNMTIQQVSDSLNFPSQTFFGKYFKRRVGLSPKEYRRIG